MKNKRYWFTGGILLFVFVLFTGAVMLFDVGPIGPRGSNVGFSSLNGFVFHLLGESPFWYRVTDILGMAVILVALCFALLGLRQFLQRRSLRRVDGSILALGVFYFVLIASYGFFEVLIVNYRPVILEQALEASYPSSHTVVALCVLSTAIMQLHGRIKNRPLRVLAEVLSAAVMAITVIGRLLSGVHWFTDIVGGILLSAAFLMFYCGAVRQLGPHKSEAE